MTGVIAVFQGLAFRPQEQQLDFVRSVENVELREPNSHELNSQKTDV